MVADRYRLVPRESWAYLGPAFKALDADVAALEAAGGALKERAAVGAGSPTGDVAPYLWPAVPVPDGVIRTINRINVGTTASQVVWSDLTVLKVVVQNTDPTNNLLIGYGTYGSANPPATPDTVPPGQEWVGSAAALPVFARASAGSIDALVTTYRGA